MLEDREEVQVVCVCVCMCPNEDKVKGLTHVSNQVPAQAGATWVRVVSVLLLLSVSQCAPGESPVAAECVTSMHTVFFPYKGAEINTLSITPAQGSYTTS